MFVLLNAAPIMHDWLKTGLALWDSGRSLASIVSRKVCTLNVTFVIVRVRIAFPIGYPRFFSFVRHGCFLPFSRYCQMPRYHVIIAAYSGLIASSRTRPE